MTPSPVGLALNVELVIELRYTQKSWIDVI
jgi:hypothetical protein